jgi:hypothetical protein
MCGLKLLSGASAATRSGRVGQVIRSDESGAAQRFDDLLAATSAENVGRCRLTCVL